ncbi:MAG: NAD(P)H-dependent glycerol-3-phosphate dehydrogenase [Candidatus Altimarinota bacterium]
MKIVIIGVGAFGFAILNHLSKNHPNTEFFAYEKDEFVLQNLKNTRENPYFFSGTKLQNNVTFLDNLDNISDFDVIIIAIPAQFVGNFIKNIQNNLKSGVTFLNLSKGINNETLQTPSDILQNELGNFSYHYAILSGGMIAGELVEEKILGAQIGCENIEIAKQLQFYFENKNLKISLSSTTKNIELFGSIKNIFALYMGYLEASGLGMSSVGYYFCELYKELPVLLQDLGGEKSIEFSDFSLGGDLIATCFGNSRNRYFGNLVGNGKNAKEAEEILKQEKKHAEGYYTLLGIQDIILKNEKIVEFRKIIHIFLSNK